jgi:hypothetical protein
LASGFIILKDGRCLAVRNATYDALLRSVMAAMEDGSSLRAWLHDQIPSALDDDFGYAFIRATDGEHVDRYLDLRGLTAANRSVFDIAVRRAEPVEGPFAPVEDVIWALQRFREMLDRCDRGEPPLELSDWTCEAPPVERRIGPDWEDSF